MTKKIDVWSWRGGVENFGDELGPEVLRRLGYQVTRVDRIGEAELLSAGSILENASENARPGAIIWGCGLMDGEPVDVSHLDVRAVRGTLTAKALGLNVPVGDPGSLVPSLWTKPPVKRDLGVVQHYADHRDYAWADAVIRTDAPVDEVISFIGSSARIASSSLHGLVVAGAWGIPCVRLHHEAVAGGDFKWADWLSGTGITPAFTKVLP